VNLKVELIVCSLANGFGNYFCADLATHFQIGKDTLIEVLLVSQMVQMMALFFV